MTCLSHHTMLMRFLCCVLLALVTANCFAAKITGPTPRGIARIDGPIEPGDVEKFVSLLKGDGQLLLVELNSPGGDIRAAIKLGRYMREGQIHVQVPQGGLCASACFFIFLGGSGRLATSAEDFESRTAGPVGLHRPYLTQPTSTTTSKQVDGMALIKKYLEYKMVPGNLIDKMLSRPSNDIYWLTQADLDLLGEYPPELEELYIAKCGYDRNRVPRVTKAKMEGRLDESAKLKAKAFEVARCMAKYELEAYDIFVAKLRLGWRPKMDI